MSKLGQLLSYLERPDVTELIFRSGSPAVMQVGNRQHPLTITPLKVAQIRRFFAGTEVVDHLPTSNNGLETHSMALMGTPYLVTIGGDAHSLEIRVGNTANEPEAAPVQVTDQPSSTREPPTEQGQHYLPHQAPTDDRPAPPSADRPTPAEPVDSGLVIERNDDFNASFHGGAQSLSSPVPDEQLPQMPPIERGGMVVDEGMPAVEIPRTPRPGLTPVEFQEQTQGRASALSTADLPRQTAETTPAPRPPPPRPPASGTRTDTSAMDEPLRPRSVHPGLREILTAARQHGASDVHIMSDAPVRVRRVGALEPAGTPVPAGDVADMVDSLLEPRHRAQLESLGYADLGSELEGAGRLRININRQRTGLKICVRLVVTVPPSLEALGLPPEVRKLTTHHQGLAIISGPNGHGKTTTMSALVDMFNAHKAQHIITVEDPVEVIHPRKQALVTQREVGTHTRSFEAALAASLREDPDIIAIGELRDRETVEMALSASETGHLVLATMSTPSGAKTIDRVIDMFPPDDQSQVRATLAGALKLVISQRLLRRADGRGLVAAYEMITGNVPLWTLIRDSKLFQLPSLLQRGRNFGMIRLEDSLRELLDKGVIDRAEAELYAEDPRALSPTPSAQPPPPPPPKKEGWRFGRGR
ncbi:MAG: PilT/PilU family type 4a pilus ATPase [Myxococcota bacterium]